MIHDIVPLVLFPWALFVFVLKIRLPSKCNKQYGLEVYLTTKTDENVLECKTNKPDFKQNCMY